MQTCSEVSALDPEPTVVLAFRKLLWLTDKIVVVWLLSSVRFFATPWTVAHQAPPSMRFPRQKDWSGLPFPSPGGSSWGRGWTWVSCIGRWVLYHWAIRETQLKRKKNAIKIQQFLKATFKAVKRTFKNILNFFLKNATTSRKPQVWRYLEFTVSLRLLWHPPWLIPLPCHLFPFHV